MFKIKRSAFFALLMLVTGVAFAQQPTISSTLNNRPNVYTNTLQNFTVSTVANSEAGHMVKVKMALASAAQASNISLEYYETSNSSWMPLTFDSNGEFLWGPPSTGFPLMDATSQFRITCTVPATYNYSLTIVDASTNAVVGSPASESVIVTNYVAPSISSDLNGRPNVMTGAQESFSVTTVANSEAGHMVKVKMALASVAQANDIALEYYETATSAWMPLAFDSNGEILWGPPSTGFPLMDASSQFRITFSATGTYNYALTIVDASTSAVIGSTANESVTVSVPYVAPVISSDLDNRPNVLVNVQEQFTVTTIANSEAGHMVKVKMALATIAQANDIALEYYETTTSTWMPLAFDSNGEILWGPPSTGFPLMDASSQFRITFSAAGTYNYALTIVDASTSAVIGSTANESVTVSVPYVAPVISSDLDNRPNVLVNVQEQFTVTTTANSEAGHMVKVKMALATIAQANDIALEYYETTTSTWMPLTFDSNGEILWGPATGFPLMDATSQFRITFAANGTYDYSLSMVDATTGAIVGSAANESVFVDVDTRINTVKGTDVKIYPNPASSVIKVEGTEISKANIIVYNVLGKAVASVANAGFNTTIDVTGLDKGVYFVRIENNGTVITKKINVTR